MNAHVDLHNSEMFIVRIKQSRAKEHSSGKKQLLLNLVMLHSAVGTDGESLRYKNNLQSMLGLVGNDMSAGSHPSSRYVMIHEDYVSQLVYFQLRSTTVKNIASSISAVLLHLVSGGNNKGSRFAQLPMQVRKYKTITCGENAHLTFVLPLWHFHFSTEKEMLECFFSITKFHHYAVRYKC